MSHTGVNAGKCLDTTIMFLPLSFSLFFSSHGVSWLLHSDSYFSLMTWTGFSFFPVFSSVCLKRKRWISVLYHV
jgi:hypothetical protein